MGEPLKIERIEDMSWLSWLEHVITEASLMTRSIRLHSILMNWMCFPLQVWGGFAPPVKFCHGAEGWCRKQMARRHISWSSTSMGSCVSCQANLCVAKLAPPLRAKKTEKQIS